MKKVKNPKAEQEAENAYKWKRYLDDHAQDKDPEKRQKMDSGASIECFDTNKDVEMMNVT